MGQRSSFSRVFFFFLSWIFLNLLSPCVCSDYYVSISNGSDTSGVGDGTKNAPWASLHHAILEIRSLRGQNPLWANPQIDPPDESASATLNILDGVYFLNSILRFDQRDSYLTLKPWNSTGTVVISGGLKLSNSSWTELADGVRQRTFKGKCGETFVSGRRLIPARSPNLGPESSGQNGNIFAGPYHHYAEVGKSNPNSQFKFDKASLLNLSNPKMDTWHDLNQTKVILFQSWFADFKNIKNGGVNDDGSNWEVNVEPLGQPINESETYGGKRFVLYNNLALLDSAGESVCVDLGNGEATITYIPPIINGKKDFSPVVVSQLAKMVLIQKTYYSTSRVSGVTFKGISFRHSSSENRDGYNWGTHNAVSIESSDDIRIEDCEFAHTGMTGLFLRDANVVTVTNNVFHDIGYNGIFAYHEPLCSNLVIDHNTFDGCGINNLWQPGAILLAGKENITVANNDIRSVSWSGIYIRARMTHGPSNRNDSVYKVQYNRIDDVGQGILNDLGAVYVAAWTPPGAPSCNHQSDRSVLESNCFSYAHIYNNLILNVKAYHNHANCLYSDVDTSKTTFENNIMRGEWYGNALYHHCGIENLSKNNIIHRKLPALNNDRNGNTAWGGCENNWSSKGAKQNYTNERNIYLFESMDNFTFGRTFDTYNGANFHDNIYWSVPSEDDKNNAKFPNPNFAVNWKLLNWAAWKAVPGNDMNSRWADPLFEDANNLNYTLKSGSPAENLNIANVELNWIPILEEKTNERKNMTEKNSINYNNLINN